MKYRKTINNFILYLMVLALCIVGFSKDKEVEGIWASTPVKIDGSNSDWSGDPLIFENKVKVDYAFRNDSENLYVLFIFKDTEYLSSINQTGMTLWVDTQGKKKKNYGIKFQRKRLSADAYISLLEKRLGPMPEEKKKEIKSKPAYIVYLNEVIDEKGKSFMAIGPTAPSFKSMHEKKKNMMIYEFRIPLKKAEDQPAGIGTEPGKVLKVGFEWGGMTKEMRAEMMKRRAASGKVSDREAGISEDVTQERDGVTGSQTMPFRKPPKKYSFWVDVKLAQNQ